MKEGSLFGVHHKHQPLHDKINPKDCQVKKPLVIQGCSNFLGLFQVIMANPVIHQPGLTVGKGFVSLLTSIYELQK